MRVLASGCRVSMLVGMALTTTFAHAQVGEVPGTPHAGPQPTAVRALGDVLFDVPIPSGNVPIGLEHDGQGGLLFTEIATSQVSVIDTAGVLQSVCGTATGGVQSVTTDGAGRIWVTNTTNATVEELDASCQPVSSFAVGTQTTFPDSITYNPTTGTLFVVDADLVGSDNVIEYTTAGALLGMTPLATASTDGIAYDAAVDGYWIYDSGSDSLTLYDNAFVVITSFPGVVAAGFVQGEGVAVLDGVCYVVATGSDRMVAFDCDQSTPPFFADDFESGDTTAWTATVP